MFVDAILADWLEDEVDEDDDIVDIIVLLTLFEIKLNNFELRLLFNLLILLFI